MNYSENPHKQSDNDDAPGFLVTFTTNWSLELSPFDQLSELVKFSASMLY